jgi:hypothetical protein
MRLPAHSPLTTTYDLRLISRHHTQWLLPSTRTSQLALSVMDGGPPWRKPSAKYTVLAAIAIV